MSDRYSKAEALMRRLVDGTADIWVTPTEKVLAETMLLLMQRLGRLEDAIAERTKND